LERLLKLGLGWLVRCEIFLAVAALLSVAIALVADVLGREVLGSGLFGSQRYAVFNNAVASLMGFAIVVHLGGHLRVSVIDNLFPVAWRVSMGRVADLVSACICGFFLYHAIDFVQKTATGGDVDPVLGIKVWIVQLVLPYIFVASALRYLSFAWYPALRPADESAQ
jgi:C4-dicarboxylate transporter, DctQ subunit